MMRAAAASRSQPFVLCAMSVKRKVTVPAGNWGMPHLHATDSHDERCRTVSHDPASTRRGCRNARYFNEYLLLLLDGAGILLPSSQLVRSETDLWQPYIGLCWTEDRSRPCDVSSLLLPLHFSVWRLLEASSFRRKSQRTPPTGTV